MSGITSSTSAGAPPPVGSNAERHATLRKAAHQLEGVFLAQLFSVMRQTVPDSGSFSGGSGEEMYQSMRDDMLASTAAAKSVRGLGEQLYHQLSRHLPPEDKTAATGTTGATGATAATATSAATQTTTQPAIQPATHG